MNAWLAQFPTTNARIAVSILLVFGTGVSVLLRWTDPPVAWLTFLAVALGLDTTHFYLKRITTFNPSGGKANEETSA